MDKLVAFFKNVWLTRGVALICWSYTALLCWVSWLNFAYDIQYDNPTSLFILYVFVSVAALGLMIYTRRQVFTMINCMVMPLVLFTIVFFGFGNWYLIIPPAVVVVAMFFINTANETLKTVLGTMYLLMFVIGIAGYLAIEMLFSSLSFTGVELEQRDRDYEKLSPSGEYRIVRYVDKPTSERRTAQYYIEATEDDTEIPFGFCKKVFGCRHALTSQYTGSADDPIDWIEVEINGIETEMLSVEGSLRENPYLKEEVGETSETDDMVSVPAFGDEKPESGETSATAETSANAESGETAAVSVSTAEAA